MISGGPGEAAQHVVTTKRLRLFVATAHALEIPLPRHGVNKIKGRTADSRESLDINTVA